MSCSKWGLDDTIIGCARYSDNLNNDVAVNESTLTEESTASEEVNEPSPKKWKTAEVINTTVEFSSHGNESVSTITVARTDSAEINTEQNCVSIDRASFDSENHLKHLTFQIITQYQKKKLTWAATQKER